MNLFFNGDINIQRKYENSIYFIQAFKNKKNLSYKTNGLKGLIGYELEYNLSLEPSEAVRITDYILPRLKDFKIEDDLVTNVLTGAPVLLKIISPITKSEENEKVLRIIFSDEAFKLPNDIGCHPSYKNQI